MTIRSKLLLLILVPAVLVAALAGREAWRAWDDLDTSTAITRANAS